MLQIKDLTITHLKDNRVIINKLSLVLNGGDKAAIIGEEGNGKSTLLKLIYDERLVEGYVEYTGEIIRNGLHMGYLAQELTGVEKAMSVYEFMCESSMFFERTPQELSEAARQLGITTELLYSDQRVADLSGGEKIKVQLARVILGNPDILLLDEPSNDLDIATIEWLEAFINDCTIPVLYISHDETLLENTANKIIHLEQIKRKMEARATVTKAGYTDYIENRGNALTRQEQLARKERAEYDKQQEKFRQIQQKVEQLKLEGFPESFSRSW